MMAANYEVYEEQAAKKGNGLFITTLRRLKRNKMAVIGLVIIIFFILIAILAPWIMPYDYQERISRSLCEPSAKHWFGTDDLGRDILSRLMYGARYSLQIGIFSVAGACVGGTFFGSIAGYFGGWIDNVIMRFLEIIQAVPGMVLSIAVSAVLGPGFGNSILALTIGMIPSFSRLMRASVLNIRKMEYIEASTSINCTNFRIIWRHILPNSLSPLIVQATMSVPSAILIAASLSFIGLGIQTPTPEWGAMLPPAENIFAISHLYSFPALR